MRKKDKPLHPKASHLLDFNTLKEQTGANSGNLSVQI